MNLLKYIMKKIKLQRIRDLNGKSGIGDVWEGVEFDNKMVAGRWNCNISSHGTYSNIEALREIHGHNGNTEILDSSLGKLFNLIAKDPNKIIDKNPLVAQGYECTNGLIILMFLANINSIYFYENIEDLKMIYGDKIYVREYIEKNTEELFKRKSIFI